MVQITNPLLNPYTESNLISKCFFIWCIKFFSKVSGSGAHPRMLFAPRDEDQCKNSTQVCEELFCTGKSYRRTTLSLRIIILNFVTRSDFIQWFLIAFASAVLLRAFTMMTLAYTLTELALDDPNNKYDIVGLSIISFFYILLLFLMVLMRILRQFWGLCYGERLSIGLRGILYEKMTKLPQRILTNEKVKELIDIMFIDVSILRDLPMTVQDLSLSVLVFLTSILLLFAYLGTAGFIGFGIYLLVATPMQMFFSYMLVTMERTLKAKRATTVGIISDVIDGIDTVKTQCLGDVFIKILRRAHDREMRFSVQCIFPQVLLWSAYTFWHRLGLLTTIVIFHLQGNILTVGQLMLCILVFEYFCTYFLTMIADSIEVFMKSAQVLKSVQDFLRMTEEKRNTWTPLVRKWEIHFIDVSTLSWQGKHELKKINLRINSGKLTVICGSANSGAQSIVPVLIDEVHLQEGDIKVGGAVSYYFKHGFLLEGSIKRNITLGRKFDQHQYNLVKKLCGLNSELRHFPSEDETVLDVEEYWPALEQKITFARTLYAIANIYVFEQPPLQVVSSTQRLIFEDAITKYLRGITRLVISNQYYYLKQADRIYFLENGAVRAAGDYDQICRQFPDFNLIVKHGTSAPHEMITVRESGQIRMKQQASKPSVQYAKNLLTTSFFRNFKKRQRILLRLLGGRKEVLSTFLLFAMMFFTAGLSFFALFILFQWSTDLLIIHYSNTTSGFVRQQKMHRGSTVIRSSLSDFFHVPECRAFFITVVVIMVLWTVEYFILARICIHLVRRLYKTLVETILNKALLFFYDTPAIILYELLANDIYRVQDYLPKSFIAIVEIFSTLMCTLILFVILDIYLAGLLIVYLIICLYMYFWFKKTCRRMLRLEHTLRFPIINHITQTKNMLTILRCSELMDQQMKMFFALVNKHSTATFMVITLRQAFREWLSLLTILLTILIVILYGYQYIKLRMYSNEINIVMYYVSVIISGYVTKGIDGLFNFMYLQHHTKRIARYDATDNLEDTESGLRYPKIWLSAPSLRFTGVCGPNFGHITVDFRSLYISSGEHVGLIGRTGSGRRVLMKMLLRLYPHEGCIQINSIKIDQINVCSLRRNIFYISAATSLFAPSIRFNLDPRNEFTDSMLWSALKTVGLTSQIISLESPVQPDGANITVEQKILLLFTRVILLQSKMIIIDHIFEQLSIDMSDFIEDLIYAQFGDCTLIFLETRLNYIMRCDRLIVLDRGRIMDDDKPAQIYDNRTNFLHTIVDKTGYVNSTRLNRAGYTRREMVSHDVQTVNSEDHQEHEQQADQEDQEEESESSQSWPQSPE